MCQQYFSIFSKQCILLYFYDRNKISSNEKIVIEHKSYKKIVFLIASKYFIFFRIIIRNKIKFRIKHYKIMKSN